MRIDRGVFLTMASALACQTSEPEPVVRVPAIAPSEPKENSEVTDEPAEPNASPSICEALVAPEPSCESFYLAVSFCKRIAAALDPEQGAPVMGCIEQGNATEMMCDFGLVTCIEAAGGEDGAEAVPGCDVALRPCGYVREATPEACQRAHGRVKNRLRPALLSCLAEHCDIGVCLWGHAHIAE